MDFSSTEDTSLNRSSDDGGEELENLEQSQYFNATKKGKLKVDHLK